jgi:hypothetical protein
MAPKLCSKCGVLPKLEGRHSCVVCYYRTQPIGERVLEAKRRLAMVPEEARRKTVPAKHWPAGERWCAGCQSFVLLIDCQGSRCVACASSATHGARLEKVYGIDAAEYDRLLALQGGKCAICRARPKSKRLAVDHDHKTGEVLGLLCSRCNHDLKGAAWDSQAIALALWHYINTPPTSGHWIAPERGLVAPIDPALVPEEDEPIEFLEPTTERRVGGRPPLLRPVDPNASASSHVCYEPPPRPEIPDLAAVQAMSTEDIGRLFTRLRMWSEGMPF